MKRKTIKKLIIGVKFALICSYAQAQGLENVIIEKYYVSNLADSIGSVGDLPVGSVTYRLYADMQPGYKFQALYGVPSHTLTISTSTSFFNNEDRGATTPSFTKNQSLNNTVMLDTWFSVGAAASNQLGVPKVDDDGANNAVNNDGILQNADAIAGIPLTVQDGFLAGAPSAVTFVGISASDLNVFDGTSNVGNLFTTHNGSVACLGGSVGPNPASNQVLIGQFTTNGDFHFELNIQIGTPSGGAEQYVAQNPTGTEQTASFLTYTNSLTTSVSSLSTPTSCVNIYPNPATDILTLIIHSPTKNATASYKMFDVLGNLITQKNTISVTEKQQETIDISSLSRGLYFVELTVDGKTSSKKLVKN